MKKIITLLLLLCSLSVFPQTIYYVKKTGSDANNGTSWATAYQTLQKALATISTGQIWVAAGTYYPDEGGGKTNNDRLSYFSMRSGVAIYGGFPATGTPGWTDRNWTTNVTTLSGDIDGDGNSSDNAYHVVFSKEDNNSAVLDGFTITAGYATGLYPRGGGMRNDDSSPLLRNCTFTGNTATTYGGGMYNNNSDPLLINCRFHNNTAVVTNSAYGGAMYNANSSAPTMINCLFTSNHAAQGTAIYNDNARPNIINCTFTGNNFSGYSYYYGSAIYNTDGTYAEITNSILWGDAYDEINNERNGTGVVSYSIVQGGYGGTGNLNMDPMFISSTNLHLKGCSPAINSATSILAPNGDYEGKSRPVLGGYDMGAYEFQPGGPGSILYVKKDATGLNNGTSWANAYTALQDALTRAAACYSPSQVWVAAGTYYPDEGAGLTDNNRALSFALKNNTSVYGGFAGTETQLNWRSPSANPTILSGDIDGIAGTAGNAYHVVTSSGNDATAVLDGFTITGGNANTAGNNLGGGMYNTSSSPTVVRCSFENNTANQGGGMYNKASSPTLKYCRFSANTANFGGGLYNESNTPVLDGCSFMVNEALTDGGGVYNYGASATLVNCVFWGNTADAGGGLNNFFSTNVRLTNCSFAANTATVAGKGGGIYNWMTTPTLTNSIMWANTGGQISQDPATVSYSLVQGGYSGTGNLNIDPLFINIATGNLHLQDNSPAIDTGDNAAVANIPYDGDGGARIFGTRVDLGAYEWRQAMGPWDPGAPAPLTITCPGDITVHIDPGSCGATIDFQESHSPLVMGGTHPVTVTYSPLSGTELPLGEHVVTVTATDGAGVTQSCSFTVTVIDEQPPVISCPGSIFTKYISKEACSYTVQGTELDVTATDNCTAPLTYFYSLSGATTTEGLVEASTLSGLTLNRGETTIRFLVVDAAGLGAGCNRVVRVEDITAPVITKVSASPSVLYPPNHKMQAVTINYEALDCNPVTTLSVTSNEPQYGTGSGDTGPDWEIIDNHKVKLRAERSGSGNGRVYTITITAIDEEGNTATATTTVTVPHDKGAPVTAAEAVGLQVKAQPNPSTAGFVLTLQSASHLPLDIEVRDAAGRVIERRTGVAPNGVLQLGNDYRPGVYHVQVVQGSALQTITLIKQAH